MTTNLLSVIEQLVGALINLDKVWRESNESDLGLQGEKNNSFYTLEDTTSAIAAGKQALEQTKEYSMRDWFNDLDNPHANR